MLVTVPTNAFSINKIFDYMYSGKPIIHSVNTSNDLVQIAKAGVSIQPENPREIANKIIEISNMGNEILNKWGENGKKADPTAKKGIGDDGEEVPSFRPVVLALDSKDEAGRGTHFRGAGANQCCTESSYWFPEVR